MPKNSPTAYKRPVKVSKYRREYDNRINELKELYLEAVNSFRMAGSVIQQATDVKIRPHFNAQELTTVTGLVKEINEVLKGVKDSLEVVGEKLKTPPAYVHKNDQATLDFLGWGGTINQELVIITTTLTEKAMSKFPIFYGILDDVTKRLEQPVQEAKE